MPPVTLAAPLAAAVRQCLYQLGRYPNGILYNLSFEQLTENSYLINGLPGFEFGDATACLLVGSATRNDRFVLQFRSWDTMTGAWVGLAELGHTLASEIGDGGSVQTPWHRLVATASGDPAVVVPLVNRVIDSICDRLVETVAPRGGESYATVRLGLYALKSRVVTRLNSTMSLASRPGESGTVAREVYTASLQLRSDRLAGWRNLPDDKLDRLLLGLAESRFHRWANRASLWSYLEITQPVPDAPASSWLAAEPPQTETPTISSRGFAVDFGSLIGSQDSESDSAGAQDRPGVRELPGRLFRMPTSFEREFLSEWRPAGVPILPPISHDDVGDYLEQSSQRLSETQRVERERRLERQRQEREARDRERREREQRQLAEQERQRLLNEEAERQRRERQTANIRLTNVAPHWFDPLITEMLGAMQDVSLAGNRSTVEGASRLKDLIAGGETEIVCTDGRVFRLVLGRASEPTTDTVRTGPQIPEGVRAIHFEENVDGD